MVQINKDNDGIENDAFDDEKVVVSDAKLET